VQILDVGVCCGGDVGRRDAKLKRDKEGANNLQKFRVRDWGRKKEDVWGADNDKAGKERGRKEKKKRALRVTQAF